MAVSEEPTYTSTSSESMGGSEILRVEDLHTSFFLPIGELQAVRGVSFSLDRGRSLGIVGESGSGKSVLARSIMRLNLGSNVKTSGSAFFDGRDLLALSRREMRSLWGTEIAMIFQDPMTSLNPPAPSLRYTTLGSFSLPTTTSGKVSLSTSAIAIDWVL